MTRWRVILAAMLDDIARNPGWWSLVAYAGALFAYETAREHKRLRVMVDTVRQDMTDRADEIAERMERAVVEEFAE